MVLHCSFFFDVALKLWKASSAGRSRAGWRRNWILRKKSKDQTQLNCKREAGKKPEYFVGCIFQVTRLSAFIINKLRAERPSPRLPGFASRALKDT
jgi:hypothetical protein